MVLSKILGNRYKVYSHYIQEYIEEGSISRVNVKLKNRIISSFTVFSMLMVLLLSPVSAFSEGVSENDDYCHQNIEIHPNEEETEMVTLDGIMPEGATATAIDVTDEYMSILDSVLGGEEFSKAEMESECDSPYSFVDIASTGEAISEATVGDSVQDMEQESAYDYSYELIAAYDISIKDGDEDYQPGEERPILVEISNPDINYVEEQEKENSIKLWHIKDNGEAEEISDFKVEEGRISFYATGFSVYVIADIPEPYQIDTEYVTKLSDFDSEQNENAEKGFYLYYTDSKGNNNFITNSINGNNAFIESGEIVNASIWYFEKTNSENEYKIYTVIGGVKKYIHNKSGNLIELTESGDTADIIVLKEADTTNSSFFLKNKNQNKWLQHSNGGSGIRYYTDNKDANNSRIKAIFASSMQIPDDPYDLDGKTYGIVCNLGGAYSYALSSNINNSTSLKSTELLTKINPLSHNGYNYVDETNSVSMWKFNKVEGNTYKLSTIVNDETKYLVITNGGLELTDSDNASLISATPGIGLRDNKIKLSVEGYSISYEGEGNTSKIFKSASGDAEKMWFYLVEPSEIITQDDFVVYSAEKVSVSDKKRVKDGSKVIVYTRVWNDSIKSYEFYAVDHDGTLVPCYERGDNIMWVGSKINTLEWEFTAYMEDGVENNYYELYNPYSKKYIAPQLKDNQVLSDNTIGLNLRGRTSEGHYTDILAWDDKNYSYAGLKADIENSKVASCRFEESETFYFAILNPGDDQLTPVDTIDNNEYGISMKMIDWKNNSDQNALLGGPTESQGKVAYPGLLSSGIDTSVDENNKYPVAPNSNKSLSELFSGATIVNHLFLESTYNASGYFEFDSCQNFATLKDTNTQYPQKSGEQNFVVYKELGTSNKSNRTTLSHGQFFPYDRITAGNYSTKNALNLYSALAFPNEELTGVLSEADPRKYERLYSVGDNPNYYNGMEMEASFVQTPSGKDAWGHDIIFEFTGDDDFWFYVDNELVIDLGGIHSALAGTANFATGDVVVNGTHTTLREIFYNNYLGRGHTSAEAEAYVNGIFEKNDEGDYVFKDYSPHTMRIFYMERGAGASNLHMRFNLSYVTPGQVMMTKEVSGVDNLDYNLVEYPYQIYYKTETNGEFERLSNNEEHFNVSYLNPKSNAKYYETYRPPSSNITYQDVYFLHPGRSVAINFPDDTIGYYIKECALNADVYETVTCNDEEMDNEDSSGDPGRKEFKTVTATVKERPNVVLNNHVDPDGLRDLSITKELYEKDGVTRILNDTSTFGFRLYLSNEYSDELKYANMHEYHIKDPQGNYVYWDGEAQEFKSFGKNDFTKLSKEQQHLATFQTSMYGSISKIPAWYTVEVPDLLVGTKFKVEERDSEVPLGYKLIGFERKPGDTEGSFSYDIEEGDSINIGKIKKTESPAIAVKNKRGFELKAEKLWSDKEYTSSHGSIYTAVYAGDEIVAGTVKEVVYPNTTVRYFFDDLIEGKSFSDYAIYEVELENPVKDSEGNLTYTSVRKRLLAGELTDVSAVAKGKPPEDETLFHYSVEYNRGTPEKTASDVDDPGNIRTDTINNVRTGGIVITLYDMNTKEALPNGIFTLKKGDTNIGTFTSDENGRVTILYDFDREVEYSLVESSPPSGYIGIPNTAVFKIENDDSVTVTGNDEKWTKGYKSSVVGDKLVAYVDVYNKPFTLSAIKVESGTDAPLKGAVFSLYRGVSGVGGIVKDYYPMSGYDELETDADGVIPKVDLTLGPGTYFLVEKTPPQDYEKLKSDVRFKIDKNGGVKIESSGHEDFLSEKDVGGVSTYTLAIPNSKKSVNIPTPTGIRRLSGKGAILILLMGLVLLSVNVYYRKRLRPTDGEMADDISDELYRSRLRRKRMRKRKRKCHRLQE